MAGNAARAVARRRGRRAENKALRILKKSGLKLIKRNFRCRLGEIDLVMRDSSGIVIVEVRYRKINRFASAALSVDRHKQARLTKAAALFLASDSAYANCSVRFDVVAFNQVQDGECTLQWIRDAFRPD